MKFLEVQFSIASYYFSILGTPRSVPSPQRRDQGLLTQMMPNL